MKNLFKFNLRQSFLACSVGAGLFLSGCAGSTSTSTTEIINTETQTDSMEAKDPQIAHYVLFWLKEDLTEQQVTEFAQFFEDLKAIPGIQSLHYGRPADTTPRDVVDNSFSYNLLVYFDSMEDLHVYEEHPIHLEAIAKYSSQWTKVSVHDSWLNR